MDATKLRDNSHARLYSTWAALPTWRALSTVARALLAEILMRYRPADNGSLQWPVRRAADVLGVSKDTAARALVELERNGWLFVTKVAGFGGAHHPAHYRLTMFNCPVTGQLATHAYKFMEGERLSSDRKTRRSEQRENSGDGVPHLRLNSPTGRTPQSQEKDAGRPESDVPSNRDKTKKPHNSKGYSTEAETGDEGDGIRPDEAIDIIAASPALTAQSSA